MRTLKFAKKNLVIRNLLCISEVLEEQPKAPNRKYFINIFMNGYSCTEHFNSLVEASERLEKILDKVNNEPKQTIGSRRYG